MTNRTPYIAPEQREEHAKTCFPQPAAKKAASDPKTATKPMPKAKPAPKAKK
jgi:hypothetical protein